MIQRTADNLQAHAWKKLLAQAYRDPHTLLAKLQLHASQLDHAIDEKAAFVMRVPEPYVARMRCGDPHDPLLRQVLPLQLENHQSHGYVQDPVGDCAATVAPGVLHKYHGRVLNIATGVCAVHCRYCFRRHYPYDDVKTSQPSREKLIDYLNANPHVNEVILSGGDPLSLDDERLQLHAAPLAQMSQIKTLRIHTRLPVVIPQRITIALCDWIASNPLKIVVVVHINHANEIDEHVIHAMQQLKHSGATLLNQSVLLRGVNDSETCLVDLSEALFTAGILPYYLHQLDPVQGAAHFHVTDEQALVIMRSLQARLPGYLVPRLVREQAGACNKMPLY